MRTTTVRCLGSSWYLLSLCHTQLVQRSIITSRMAGSHSTASDQMTQEWVLPVAGSRESHGCINLIRQLIEDRFLDAIQNCDKELYRLGIGDPTVFGNLHPPRALLDAVKKSLETSSAGYAHSAGLEVTRRAVAEFCSTEDHQLTEHDVVMTVGTTGALDTSMATLCNPGQCILLPKPCYTIYKCLADTRGIELKYYKLLPEREWEVDLEDLEKQIDENTAAILVTNPSNPCGSVFSRQHITDILAVAERHKKPIIADEVYAEMVFKGTEYHSFGSVSKNVPVLSCGSISKRFLVPGWRVGWVSVFDKHDLFKKNVKPGVFRMATKLISPSVLIQAALPDTFKNVPESFYSETMEVFENNAKACFSELSKVPGLTPIMPDGAMYIMIKIDMANFPDFDDDIAFLKQLIVEQGVMCLPGTIFQYPNAMRIALIMQQDKLMIACSRIAEFCKKHYSNLL